jgi:hypothetical protein
MALYDDVRRIIDGQRGIASQWNRHRDRRGGDVFIEIGEQAGERLGGGGVFRVVSNDVVFGVYNCRRQALTLSTNVRAADANATNVKVLNGEEIGESTHRLNVGDRLLAWPIGITGAPLIGRVLIKNEVVSAGSALLPKVSHAFWASEVTVEPAMSYMVATAKSGTEVRQPLVYATPLATTPTTRWRILGLHSSGVGFDSAPLFVYWIAV